MALYTANILKMTFSLQSHTKHKMGHHSFSLTSMVFHSHLLMDEKWRSTFGPSQAL